MYFFGVWLTFPEKRLLVTKFNSRLNNNNDVLTPIILIHNYENKVIIYTILKLKQIGERELFYLEHTLMNNTKDIFMNY